MRQIGNAADALAVIAWLVLLVAAVSITVAIYNTMNERRREIRDHALAPGARRAQILTIITGEAALLSFFGALLGLALCHAAAFALQGAVEDMTGVFLDWAQLRRGALAAPRRHRHRRGGGPRACGEGLNDAGRRWPRAELLSSARGPGRRAGGSP